MSTVVGSQHQPAALVRPLTGLPQTQAQDILARDGPNELPCAGRRTPLRIVGEVLPEPRLAKAPAAAPLQPPAAPLTAR